MSSAKRAARLAAILTLCFAAGAYAQTATPINFEGLPRKQQPAPATLPAKKTDSTTAKLRGMIAAQRDSIAHLRKVVRTDTVHSTDTVRLLRVDTVKVTTSPKAAPAIVTPTFTANGLVQVMFAGGDAMRSTYRMRRVEVKITADLGNRAQAILMVDAAKSLALNTSGSQPAVNQSSRILQDAFISMPVGRFTFDAGQQRLPLGYEGAMSSSGLETIDRALMESDKSRGAAFGDVRDAGVIMRRAWGLMDYRLGVFNGSGETMNDVDKQVGKAVVGQLGFHPASMKWFRVGVSGATSGRGAGDNPTRDRLGADIRLARGPVALQVEGMMGQDGPVHRVGYYGLFTYALRPQFRLVSRFDVFDPDIATDVVPSTISECDYVGGFTWLPVGTRLKLQVNVVHKTYSAGLAPSSTIVLSQLQASW